MCACIEKIHLKISRNNNFRSLSAYNRMFLFLRILNVYEYIKVHLSQTSIAWRCVKNARNKHQLMKLDHSKLLYFLCVYCKMQMSNANSVLIPFPSIFFVGSIKMFTVQPKPVFGINARFASKNKPFARYSTDVNYAWLRF